MSKFKNGDVVHIVGKEVCGYQPGKMFVAVKVMPEEFKPYWIADGYVLVDALNEKGWGCEEGRWELVEKEKEVEPIPGVYRPALEERKVGKVRVELVDDGFPLALREIARVMTWAQTAKGYKDHDWQNLPDAQVQLAAAASRHRSDQIIQHLVAGLPLAECVDPESNIVHKAHEAFGVLAQLELMLREKSV